jgi:hypothetical protein
MLKGNKPSYKAIERFCETNDFEMIEYGPNVIGENFIVCKSNSKDVTVSFMLDGYKDGNIYLCIYSDLG